MTPIITHAVKLYDGFPPGNGVLTITDDNTFVLSKVDGAGQPVSTVISTPLSALSVRGRATRLTFSAGGVRRAVDFSLGSELVGGFGGLGGDIAGGVMASRSGVAPVVAALRKGGATVKYLTYWQRRALIWAIVLGFFVVIILLFVVAGLLAH